MLISQIFTVITVYRLLKNNNLYYNNIVIDNEVIESLFKNRSIFNVLLQFKKTNAKMIIQMIIKIVKKKYQSHLYHYFHPYNKKKSHQLIRLLNKCKLTIIIIIQ